MDRTIAASRNTKASRNRFLIFLIIDYACSIFYSKLRTNELCIFLNLRKNCVTPPYNNIQMNKMCDIFLLGSPCCFVMCEKIRPEFISSFLKHDGMVHYFLIKFSRFSSIILEVKFFMQYFFSE